MLKSARDVLEMGREARERVLAEERAAHENAQVKMEEQRNQARLAAEQALIKEALAAAKKGLTEIVFPGEVSLEPLRSRGLVAKHLVRRESFERHLAGVSKEKRSQLDLIANSLVASYPGRFEIPGDRILNRNPLISLMESCWEEKDGTTSLNRSAFWQLLKNSKGDGNSWLEKNSEKIGTALKIFQELKEVNMRFDEIAWENSKIPIELERVTYLSWNAVEENCTEKSDSPALWKWLSLYWEGVSDYFRDAIETRSSNGHLAAVFSMNFQHKDKWALEYWGEGSEDDKNETAACSPTIILEEFERLGYKTNTRLLIHDDDYEIVDRIAADILRLTSPQDGDCYELEVLWG